jgi:Ca-activated chloride channel family protein
MKASGITGSLRNLPGTYRMRSLRFVLILLTFTVIAVAATIQTPLRNDEYRLELNTSLVTVEVGVYDRMDKPVTNLGKDDFLVYEDGVVQPVRSFTPVSGGYRILLLIDHSGSMQRYWSFLLDGLNLFMRNLRPQDQVAIATFDNNVQVAMPWRSAQEGNALRVGISPDGRGTIIWDSIRWAVREVIRSSGRKGVIVFTDGEDDGADFDKVMKYAAESEVPFYFVGVTTENTPGGLRMKQFAQATGGKAYFPKNPNELGPLYTSIARDLGTSYTIAYAPLKSPGDNKLRHIEIRPIDVRLRVIQSRTGYYAK